MSHKSTLIESDIIAYLKSQERKSLLRFITCGSVDDGKSTLIGRLLYESKLIYEDQLNALKQDSKKCGTQDDAIDFALLVDGLSAEREQGITIDVAYRFFSTDKRKFIVADTPGHEQYTRNMATGASTAQLAILMVDARYGIMTQTKRHSKIVQLLGVKTIVLAINKMDLVAYSEHQYHHIVDGYQSFAKSIGVDSFFAIPVSALNGDNITDKSLNMPWYTGQTLINFLETVPVVPDSINDTFTMPIQWVNRPNLDFRGFAGQITTGSISVGDSITVLPSNQTTRVASIVTFNKLLDTAQSGQSVTVTFDDEIDASRGDVLVSKASNVQVSSRFVSTIVWMSDKPMVPEKSYWFKTRAKLCSGIISTPNHKLDINTLEQLPTKQLLLNEIGECDCIFDHDIAYEPYAENSHLGSFIIIDRVTNNTVGMGLISSAIQSETWVQKHVQLRQKYWSHGHVTSGDRSLMTGHHPLLVVMTGHVSLDRYATVAKRIEQCLHEKGIHAYRYGYKFLRSEHAEQSQDMRQEMFAKLFEMAYAFLDSGQVFITAISGLTKQERADLTLILSPHSLFVVDLEKESAVSDIVCTDFDATGDSLIQLIQSNIALTKK